MEEYLKLVKYRKQFEYLDKLWDILDDNDGNLYNELSTEDTEKFDNFMNFLGDIQYKIENKLKLTTKKLLEVK